jgi:hypothetical protein
MTSAEFGKFIADETEPSSRAFILGSAASELERWSTVSETPSGRLRHLKSEMSSGSLMPLVQAFSSSRWTLSTGNAASLEYSGTLPNAMLPSVRLIARHRLAHDNRRDQLHRAVGERMD